jgi:protein-disulfide isomerase
MSWGCTPRGPGCSVPIPTTAAKCGRHGGALLALCVTAADEQDRAQVEGVVEQVQAVTGENVEIAFVDQAYTGAQAAQAAEQHGIKLEVVKLPEAKKGFT